MLILQAFLQTAGQIIFNCKLILKYGFRLSLTHLTCRLLNIYLLQENTVLTHRSLPPGNSKIEVCT